MFRRRIGEPQRGRSEAEAQKQELLQRLHVEGQALLDSVSGLDEDELSQSGVVGEWSAQDVIATSDGGNGRRSELWRGI
ncbi:MAG: hypothetical protein WKH64_09295 [Chloroflexia bacterium]